MYLKIDQIALCGIIKKLVRALYSIQYGIRKVEHENGSLQSMMELKKLYNLPHVNVLEYYRIKLLTKAFLDKLEPDLIHYREMGPFLPTQLKIFFKSQKGATDIYKVMNKSSVQPKMKVKWCQEMNEEIENFVWRNIFRVCFRLSCDASLAWFQYRLLYRIIGVRKYLATIGKDDSSVCRLCTHDEETIVHVFLHCNHSKQLWDSIST